MLPWVRTGMVVGTIPVRNDKGRVRLSGAQARCTEFGGGDGEVEEE